jgi:hypothetical protein
MSAHKIFVGDVCSMSEWREVERHGNESETRLPPVAAGAETPSY